jgi:hypothetical protein
LTKWKEGYDGSKVREGTLNMVAPLDLPPLACLLPGLNGRSSTYRHRLW